MEFLKKWKIGPVRIYVTTYRLKRRQGGCCALCGRRLEPDAMEVHHVVSASERPDLLCRTGNLLLLCPECHRRLHGRL